MLSDLFAGAALGLLATLVLIVQPGLTYGLSNLLVLAAQGRGASRAWLGAILAGFGALIGLFTGF
jgi:hypothetical protein